MSKTIFKSLITALSEGAAEKGARGILVRTVFVVLMTGPLLMLMVLGYTSTFKQFTASVYSEKKAIAYLSSTIVKERLDVLLQIGASLASRPRVIENSAAGNWDQAINSLSNALSAFPFIDALFVMDTRGILKHGVPDFKDIIGRDYYKGMKGRWAPYISEIYKRQNFPQDNVVAVSVPIKDIRDTEILGVLVMQIRLSTFAQWASEISIGAQGFIYIVDQYGQLVYHPGYDIAKDIVDYSHAPEVRKLSKGLSGHEINYNHIEKQKYLVAYEPVRKYGWGVVVVQPVKVAFSGRDKASKFALIIYGIVVATAFLFTFVIMRVLALHRGMEAALRESESRYRGLYNSIKDGLVMTDLKGVILDCNQAFLDMLGYSREALGNITSRDFTPEKWYALENSVVNEQVLSRGYSNEFEKEYIRKTGEVFPVVIRIWLRKDDSGNPLGLWAIVRDITQRRAAEEEIRALNAQLHEHALELEAINKELEAFSYSVSHDLRAPLRAMEGFSKIVLADQADKLDARGKDYLLRISAAARSMASLIDDLLNLARVARAPCRKELFDLSALVREVANDLSSDSVSKVQCSIAPDMQANGDIQLCRILLENLLGNAWKFTSRTPNPVVEVGIMQKDGTDVFFVRDNGAGFDMAYVKKLFVPFQRLHSMSDFPGSGVGLASVHRIVSRHGGAVWAQGDVNKGATFYFTLGVRP